MRSRSRSRRPVRRGFSIMELLVVVAIVAIMIGIALPILTAHQRTYLVDDTGALMIDVFRFANQRALSERQVMRVEITPSTGTTQGKIEVIDQEKIAPGTADDKVIRSELLPLNSQTTVNTTANRFKLPPSPFNFLDAPFTSGKMTIRFNPDGSAVNAADTPQSLSLYYFTPDAAGDPDPGFTRAITLFGPTSSVRTWRYDAAADDFVEM